jgi:hypothetical protein
MMMDFSRRCVARLNSHPPLKLFLSPFQGLLDANVRKEIEKDHLVMQYASAAFEKGSSRSDIDLEGLFESTKKIDTAFVSKFSNPFISIRIRHDDFAEIRKKRISAFVDMVFDLLGNWQEQSAFPHIIRQTYTEESYRSVLSRILHLYNVETKLLGNSITGRGPAAIITGVFAEKLFSTMELLSGEIAADYAQRIFAGPAPSFSAQGQPKAGGPG